MDLKNLILNKTDNIAIITINRSEKLNALNAETISELYQVFKNFNTDNFTKSVIITGAGKKAFVAGADITQITDLNKNSGQNFSMLGQKVFRYIETMPIPVIAAVNGFALGGGCELAMACHIRLASTNAKFGLPEINLGIMPGYGGTQRLPRLIGLSNALQLLLSGEMIDAEYAKRVGLVSEVMEPDQLQERAKALAQKFAQKAPLATKYILEAVYSGRDLKLENAISVEADYFGKICDTQDMKEGTSAFLEKRKAQFTGK